MTPHAFAGSPPATSRVAPTTRFGRVRRPAWPAAAPRTRLTPINPLDGGGDLLRLLNRQPAPAVGAHVLDQRHQRPTLLGERVLDPRRELRIGVPLDDALLLEGTEAKREGARADPLQRALQFAEALP